MNIGQLKKLIKDLPDSTPIVVSSSDHSYRIANAQEVKASAPKNEKRPRNFYEYYDNYEDDKDMNVHIVLHIW